VPFLYSGTVNGVELMLVHWH